MVDRNVNARPAFATLALGAILALNACDRPAEKAQNVPLPAPQVVPAPLPTLTAPTLRRLDFIQAKARAADRQSAGLTTPAGPDALVGRSFSIVLPFGCSGPLPAEAPASGRPGRPEARWAADGRAITLSLTAADWVAASPVGDMPEAWEAIDGVWIERPWITRDTCPVRSEPVAGPVSLPEPPSVGLAVVFGTEDSRLGRRNGRPYLHTVRAEGEAILIPPPTGWRVRLEGRVVGYPDGQAFHCRSGGIDTRPVCVAAVQLDRVAFEDAEGVMLSEWRPG
ncbi:hypothetical protein [Brevundimonas sp.]|uniref:hypothetical protein n=1 Tax=Brevundimonas sp. TaxID=1871086 RepID=UPI002ABC27F8|nr:hypothetical protein [Brevundimonas sp.]MDZ4364470.1 hypothetical protein [Brevundimonas sp.]